MKVAFATLLASAILARAQVATTSEPAPAQIAEAAATIMPESPVSDVKGLAFDRFYQVWLENIVRVDLQDVDLCALVDIFSGLRGLRCGSQQAVAGLSGYPAVSKHHSPSIPSCETMLSFNKD